VLRIAEADEQRVRAVLLPRVVTALWKNGFVANVKIIKPHRVYFFLSHPDTSISHQQHLGAMLEPSPLLLFEPMLAIHA
jgi:hypothetical protein